jgi:hypothetical protein
MDLPPDMPIAISANVNTHSLSAALEIASNGGQSTKSLVCSNQASRQLFLLPSNEANLGGKISQPGLPVYHLPRNAIFEAKNSLSEKSRQLRRGRYIS